MSDPRTLSSLLDRMRSCILAADFSALPSLTAEVEGHLGALAAPADTTLLADLRRKADRTARCLQAAARGLRAAHRRLDETAGAGAGFSTYASNGKRIDVGAGAQALVQRL